MWPNTKVSQVLGSSSVLPLKYGWACTCCCTDAFRGISLTIAFAGEHVYDAIKMHSKCIKPISHRPRPVTSGITPSATWPPLHTHLEYVLVWCVGVYALHDSLCCLHPAAAQVVYHQVEPRLSRGITQRWQHLDNQAQHGLKIGWHQCLSGVAPCRIARAPPGGASIHALTQRYSPFGAWRVCAFAVIPSSYCQARAAQHPVRFMMHAASCRVHDAPSEWCC